MEKIILTDAFIMKDSATSAREGFLTPEFCKKTGLNK